MTTPFIGFAFACALVITAVGTPFVRAIARRYRLHEPGSPPRLGGVALAAGFVAPLGLLLALGATDPLIDSEALDPVRVAGLCAALASILLLGVYDDVRGATPAEKLAVQLLVAVATWSLGIRIEQLTLPWLSEPLALDAWASLPLTALWVVGVINAVNLIDGLDGLAAGVSLIAVCTLFGFGWVDGHLVLCVCAAALAGALVGFLFYNFNPATIFMGDSGSQVLGYVLAIASIASTVKQYTAWALLLPVLALGLPLADTGLAVLRRLRARRPVTQPDASHVHHQLLRAGYSHRQVVLLMYGVAFTLAATALTLKASSEPARAAVIALAGAVVFAVIHLLGLPRLLGRRADPRTSPTANEVAIRERSQTRSIRQSRTPDELWFRTMCALEDLGAVEIVLELYTRDGVRWHFATPTRPRRVDTLAIPLADARFAYGELLVTRARAADPQREWQTETRLHVIVEALIDALDALSPTLQHRLVVTRLRPDPLARR